MIKARIKFPLCDYLDLKQNTKNAAIMMSFMCVFCLKIHKTMKNPSQIFTQSIKYNHWGLEEVFIMWFLIFPQEMLTVETMSADMRSIKDSSKSQKSIQNAKHVHS